MDYRKLLLQFIASLTLCDHMGDVTDDIATVLERLELNIKWDNLSELTGKLGEMDVTTLYGTSLGED